MSVAQIVQRIKSNLDKEEVDVRIPTDNDELYECFSEFLRGKSKELMVKTLNVHFCLGENILPSSGIGLVRELFTLYFQEVMRPERKILISRDNFFNIVGNSEAVEKKHFLSLGRAIVLSLLHGAGRFPYFHKDMVHFLLADRDEGEVCHSKVIHKVVTMAELREFNQLKEGLNLFNFLDMLQDHRDLENYLCWTPKFVINAQYVCEMLLPQIFSLECNGEHKDRMKNVKEWSAGLLSCMKDHQAVNLYQFVTGMRTLPLEPMNLIVDFFMQNVNSTLPTSTTCIGLLLLPLGNSNLKMFIDSFGKALEYNSGFGRI